MLPNTSSLLSKGCITEMFYLKGEILRELIHNPVVRVLSVEKERENLMQHRLNSKLAAITNLTGHTVGAHF